ncbi:uncharacterized protein L3040_006475 [Drepanopeziza brunnea f. sp. 'multigermtubi']|uniref:uncharacterized protein n=1 Tax=Drepanopeziza brunnea f. sp. 'multigermtubi' TaxID=698441 RepID=UPI002389D9AE|nr:hypothetical protein L3040_006475 [Drepanopeziza brunnea f. sp. 'multigermtubi']
MRNGKSAEISGKSAELTRTGPDFKDNAKLPLVIYLGHLFRPILHPVIWFNELRVPKSPAPFSLGNHTQPSSLVLLFLLFATFSIHFVILSFLSAGLWWSINWFVSELKAAQALQDEKNSKKKSSKDVGQGAESDTDAETVIDTGNTMPGSKETEIMEPRGELKDRGNVTRSRSEISTEDEWERVSEIEKDK